MKPHAMAIFLASVTALLPMQVLAQGDPVPVPVPVEVPVTIVQPVQATPITTTPTTTTVTNTPRALPAPIVIIDQSQITNVQKVGGTIIPLDQNRQNEQPHLVQPTGSVSGSVLQSSIPPEITNKQLIASTDSTLFLLGTTLPSLTDVITKFKSTYDLNVQNRAITVFLDTFKTAITAHAPSLMNNPKIQDSITLLQKQPRTMSAADAADIMTGLCQLVAVPLLQQDQKLAMEIYKHQQADAKRAKLQDAQNRLQEAIEENRESKMWGNTTKILKPLAITFVVVAGVGLTVACAPVGLAVVGVGTGLLVGNTVTETTGNNNKSSNSAKAAIDYVVNGGKPSASAKAPAAAPKAVPLPAPKPVITPARAEFNAAAEQLGSTNRGLSNLQTQYKQLASQISAGGPAAKIQYLKSEQAKIQTQINTLKTTQASQQKAFMVAFTKAAGPGAEAKLLQAIAGKYLTSAELQAAANVYFKP